MMKLTGWGVWAAGLSGIGLVVQVRNLALDHKSSAKARHHDFEAARQWLIAQCTKSGMPEPIDIYSKGDFKGLIFARCLSCAQRDQPIASINNIPSSVFPKTWARIDQPIDIRMAESALFAIKRMLVEWKFNKRCVRVDTDTKCLCVAGTLLVKATVENFALKLQWCDGKWEQWQALQGSAEHEKIKVRRPS